MGQFATPFECYEAIGRWLSEAAPEPWTTITVEFEIIEIDDVSEQCIYYTPKDLARREGQFFIDDLAFGDCFHQLARLTKKPGINYFQKCQFALSDAGSYRVNFTYADER